jgi:hypothetical protein
MLQNVNLHGGNPHEIREIREANPAQVLIWKTGMLKGTEARDRLRIQMHDTENSAKPYTASERAAP